MTAHEPLKAQKEAITGDVAFWLRCALDPNHPGAPAADRIVGIYMLADIASALTRIADALERNTAALEAILQRLAVPTLLPLIESTPGAEMSAAAKSEYWAGYSDGYSYGRTNPAEIDAYLAQPNTSKEPYDVGYEIGLMDAKSDGAP